MSKRLAIVFFIVIASCIFAVAGFCLMLFLAPGFSAFGLKYIRTDIHVVNTGKIQIAETKDFKTSGGFNGDLIIETTEVPINIIFSQDFDFYFAYFDNFVGLTTSDFDDPSVSISKNEHGDCIIKTQEFEKFIYESSSSKRYLNVYVPLYIVGDTGATLKNLTINTESSPITFSKEKEDSVFILPKVFIKEGESSNKAFGRYAPENIIDVDNLKKVESNDKIEVGTILQSDYSVIYEHSVWIYRAITQFVKRNSDTGIMEDVLIQNPVDANGERVSTVG